MESFDQSLKYLLQHEPADFIRFGLADPSIKVIGPLPSGLPSRGRDVDGGYLIKQGDAKIVVHVEFHRRHQRLEDLAIDVAEAQIRFYRRERRPVLSQVWDLYGDPDEPVLSDRTLHFGALQKSGRSQGLYLRVNLRALGWERLLSQGFPALWPLVTLTRDGASEQVVRRTRDAIEARAELSMAERADYLAVLWFVAEAENVPARLLRACISEERLMESTLYQSAVKKGEAKSCAETIIRVLTYRMGSLDPVVQERIRGLSDLTTLTVWYEEALQVVDAEAARKMVEKIQKAPLA